MDSFERICIVGPGAMGLLHALYLKRAGLDVTLLDHRSSRARRLTEERVIGDPGGKFYAAAVPCHATADFGPVDLLLFFVKAYSTAEAAEHAAPLIGPDTVLLTLQNGLGNLEVLGQYQRVERVLAGTTTTGATLTDYNIVSEEGLGDIALGSPVGNRDLAGRTVELFQRAGLPARVVDDVIATIWRKAVINAAINPLTAITSLENGQLLEQPDLRLLLAEVTAEAARVAEGLGIDLDPEEMPGVVEEVCRLTAHNRSSMLQDITHCRRTEVEQISGEFVRAGYAGGVPTPLNAALLALVRAIESSGRR